MNDLPPIRREVLLDVDPGLAFVVFTARIGTWWPVAQLSVFGAGSKVSFTDGRIVETSADGEQTVWGTVTRWEQGERIAFSWHPSRDAAQASQVEITFTALPPQAVPSQAVPSQAVPAQAERAQTLVTLTHSGWEIFEEPAAARAEYEQGWPGVLELYREYADQFEALLAAAADPGNTGPGDEKHDSLDYEDSDGREEEGRQERGDDEREDDEGEDDEQDGEDGEDDTWVALLHHPGPAAPTDGSLFEDPRIGDHFTFLARMRQKGYLVAAGPLTDEFGAGMTVLRLPGPGRLAEATRLATEDDASVAGGFFAVTVRPWQVALRA